MEYCETRPQEAYKVNDEGTKNLALFAERQNIPFVYISSAGIFDGKKEEYSENDTPNPLSVYGKSKYVGELVAKSLLKSIVIRAGWMMGGGPVKDKNFINKIIKQLRNGAKEIKVVNDKFGTPTYTYDLAKIIDYLLSNELYGLYHGVCEGGGSRYDIASLILKVLDLDKKVTAQAVDSEYFRESYFAPRPASEKLVNLRLKEVGANITRDWRECVEEYIKQFDWNLDPASHYRASLKE